MKTNRTQNEPRRDHKRDRDSTRANIRAARKAKAATRKALSYVESRA